MTLSMTDLSMTNSFADSSRQLWGEDQATPHAESTSPLGSHLGEPLEIAGLGMGEGTEAGRTADSASDLWGDDVAARMPGSLSDLAAQIGEPLGKVAEEIAEALSPVMAQLMAMALRFDHNALGQMLPDRATAPSPRTAAESGAGSPGASTIDSAPQPKASKTNGGTSTETSAVDAPAAPQGGDLGARAVDLAKKYQGVPYRWGGTDPKSGLDCSGLAQLVYKQLGINLPRVAADQAKVGQEVPSLNQAKPGDLIFFGSPAHHVGIYVGDGKMIDAPHDGATVGVHNIAGYGDVSHIRRVSA